MGTTNIEWTSTRHEDGTVTPGKTWNPLAGCTRVSDGCTHCYAFSLHDMRHAAYLRYNGVYPKNGRRMPEQYAKPFTEIQILPDRLEDPLHIKTPHKFFVNSMSDLFHTKISLEYIQQVFDVMRRADWHIFQILTKRGNRLQHLAPFLDWPKNVWMGVSVENDLLTRRVDQLRAVPAVVRFLSCEPLLGPLPSLNLVGIDQVIVGGESGDGHRTCRPEWVREIRDNCLQTDTAFFFKQWGGRTPKSGGRMLDGRTWDEYPKIRVPV